MNEFSGLYYFSKVTGSVWFCSEIKTSIHQEYNKLVKTEIKAMSQTISFENEWCYSELFQESWKM